MFLRETPRGRATAGEFAMATVAEIIARRLYSAGCCHAFGIPGGEVLTVMNALQHAGLRVTLTKHENCAGFMGEGAHHYDGAPAVLLTTIGPGLANGVNVIANAFQDRVPMIVLTGSVGTAEAETYTHQVFEHAALVKEVTKAQFVIADGAAEVMIDKALSIAMDGQPGPVLIDVPVGLAGREQPDDGFAGRVRPAPSMPAPSTDLEITRNWLAGAERPLLIAGVDVLNQDESPGAVAAFCRELEVPLITTYKAKGVLPEDDPLSLGGAGLSPLADKQLLRLVGQSDLIILAGYDPIEMRVGWRDPWDAERRVVEFSAVPNTHYVHQARVSFIGHVGAGLACLREGVRVRPHWPDGEPAAVREALREAFRHDEPWGPAAVVDEIRRRAPRHTVATVDSGAHRILLSQVWECYAPRGLLQSPALCTMGSALPLAMGRKLAEPERPVVAFMGDGGLEMVLGELATLRDLELPVVAVVFVDESLALIELKQRNSGYANLGVDFGATDFPAVAKALGGHGQWCEDRKTLGVAFEAALERECFTVLACRIGARLYDGRI